MPLANRTTAANGSEREQIFPLLDDVRLKTSKPGRPRKRVKVLAADKGYDSKEKRAALRKRGIRPQLPKRIYKTKKNRERGTPRIYDQSKYLSPDFNKSDVSLGIKENIVALSSDGNGKKPILMPSYFWLLFTFGLINY